MNKISVLFLVALTAVSSALHAASPADIVPAKLRAATKAAVLPGMTLSRDTVHFSWNLDGETVVAPTPHMAEAV